MYRTHTCGCLRADDVNRTVTLAGWVQKVRNLGAMTFIDLRDRYGITQIVVEEHSPAEARETACKLGRETRPDLKLGICGEHGGDPSSVEFCHRVGLDYVSCSPFRVPIARLAAAQAAIKEQRQ